jgi:type IX secretion system PorP/SprF family membrane protein
MKKQLHILLACLILGLFSFEAKAQDPEFSQFYANPLYLNPAFAGTKNCPRIHMNHRNQWPGITGSFITNSVSYDQRVEALYGGLGLIVMNDKAGQATLNTTRVSGIYSYGVNINRKITAHFGLEAAYFQRSLDWNKLTFGDMIDPRRGFVYQTNDVPRGGTVSNVDFSAGALVFSETFFAGFAAHHINEPNESLVSGDSKLPMKFTLHAGTNIDMAGPGGKYTTNSAKISPNIMYRNQGTFNQLLLGLYVKKDALTLGAWYRDSDAFILSLGIETNVFRIGYSYDVTVSKLTMASGGSHELSMGINFPCKPKRKTYRTITCPSF